ncbi:signal peptidase I [Jeotgalibaca caeni]|uniref:signal peptidase I n=1 Tax=Jeotgalibaca caeni TaxID=3028623 RepID=UPI00237D4FBA|nr:signal peptidase I [Jeotgalibaca caeni]MDE1548453.1 signal peptidase I [Jeotgalibaca caeni]
MKDKSRNYSKERKRRVSSTPPPKEGNILKEIINILISVGVAYVLFVLIRTFLFFPFQVSGDSMVPTMLDGDRLILNRLGTVDRFDVVVFPAPDPEGEGEEYVKRVIGVPGDEIVYQEDQLYIDGEQVEEKYLQPLKESLDRQLTNDFTLWDIPGSESNKVPEDMYLVLGDNREVSKDSRSFGFVPATEIEGTTSLRIWPLNRIGFLEKNE